MKVILTPAYCVDSIKPVMHGAGNLLIGRGNHCGMQILAPDISRSHCRLQVEEEQVIVFDLESRNGTFVNGERVRGSRRLENADILGLGGTMLVVELQEDDCENQWPPLKTGSSAIEE
jgi:pSer/pThr/pTyr-binding forkhead associated (FHA) protein